MARMPYPTPSMHMHLSGGPQGSFEYSWDGVNYYHPDEMMDNLDIGNEPFKYSNLDYSAQSGGVIYVRNKTTPFLEISLINTIDGPNLVRTVQAAGQVNLESGASYSELNIVNRTQWGANETVSTWTPQYRRVLRFITHHTAWTNNPSDYAATVRAIHLYHAVTLDWGDIGYNYLIAPDGTIFEGRKGGEAVIGGHTFNHNSGSIGIAFMGTFTSGEPTTSARTAYKQVTG